MDRMFKGLLSRLGDRLRVSFFVQKEMQQGVFSGLNQEQLTEQHLGQFGGSSMQENSCAARLPSGLIQVNKTAISEGLIAEETMQKQQQAASNQAEFGVLYVGISE